MSQPSRITERCAAPFTGSKVNREGGFIDDVLICGTTSLNGRDYPVAMFQRDYAKYEGKPVNCDHGRDPTVDRRLGWFTGVKPGTDGRPRGRFNLLKSHPMYERAMEAAERNPALFGFSHVAMCDTKRGPNGREVVEAIREVESIDLVAGPATTKGFFEGVTVAYTFKQLAEWVAKCPKATSAQAIKAKKLSEMDGMGDAPAMGAEPATDVDPNDVISAGFKSAIMAVIDKAMSGGIESKAALTKIKNLLNSHADATNDGVPDNDADPITPESKKTPSGSILEALDLFTEAKFPATREDLEIVAAAAPDRRKAVIERLKKATESTHERVNSAGRGSITPDVVATPPGTKPVTEAKPWGDAKGFADLIR